MITIDQYWLGALIGVFLPVIVALVTKQQGNSGVKAVVLLALSAITGTLAQVQQAGGTLVFKEAAVSTLMTFVVAVSTHFGLLKPLSITGSGGAVQKAVPKGL